MKINEYKEEVKSLTLSDDFKAQLKENMMKAYGESNHEAATERVITASHNNFVRKYSKYIALAACLLLVVSTVSIVSIGGSRIKSMQKDGNPQEPENAQTDINSEAYAFDVPSDEYNTSDNSDTIDTGETPEAPADVPDSLEDSEPNSSESSEAPEETEETESLENDSYDSPTDEQLTSVADDEEQEPVETNPMSGNGYTYRMSPDYDGDFDGEDYNLDPEIGSASNKADAIILSVDNFKSYEATVVPKDNGKAGGNIEAPQSVPPEAPQSVPPEAPQSYTETDVYDGDEIPDTDDFFDSLTSQFSYKYYDIRDGVIAKLPEVAVVRFVINDAYSGYENVSENISEPIKIDVTTQTLYSINIGYDYLNNEETDVDALFINSGNNDTQLYGRPVMEGEYIAAVSINDDGVYEPIPQLIYAVYNLNGVDIAYHVYSEDGFMVDPGDTNIGLNPDERAVIKSTVNNPEIYTQKSVVRELTYYLRRNIMRLEPNTINLYEDRSDTSENDGGENNGGSEQALPEDARTSIRANYPNGGLVYESDPDSDGLTTVNGISVGDTLEEALKAFYLTDYTFAPDCELTLIASEEQGKWYVVVTVEDGIVVKIEPHITID